MSKIAIFASGSGSNAENIVRYFENSQVASVDLIISNRKNAGVLERAQKLKVNHAYFPKETWENNPDEILEILFRKDISFIALAGFLLKVPDLIVDAFENKMVNIHPALLPAFGGKGMFGHHVHEAVIRAGVERSGITIHYVNSDYDEGDIILQDEVDIEIGETPQTLQAKIHLLEHYHFPRVIEKILLSENGQNGKN